MSSGVEGREPFVSKKIFYESLKFSKSQLIDNNHGKKPLRKILNRYMNNQFVYEKKIGFPVDMNRIFKIPKKDKINESYKIWFKKNLEEIKKL
jgi:asparagine synthase (glutamine-hydrolysing)